uniref:DUF4371 domain-containing protein n=1 Tax=Pelodiscus sinensis TaxID=13735 RepID=K7F2Y8_PELSI
MILPRVKMVEIIHRKQYGDKLKCIPLLANTVARCIENITEDLKKQVLEQVMQCGRFTVGCYTDVSNMSQFMVFARFGFNNEIHEDLIFCVPLKDRCTREDIFSTVNDFFKKNNLLWKNCVSVTIDGTAAFTEVKKGFWDKVTEIALHVKFIHCIIPRQAIAAKKLEPEVHKVLQDVIDVVNFIKTRPLNSRIFTILCNEMGSDHENLLYHTEVCWLSSGKVLNRVVELKDALRIFLLQKDKCSKFADLFCDDKWISVVCYLADIFEKINTLNLFLQGKGDVLTRSEKKLVLWKEHFENGCLERFPSLCDFVAENRVSVSPKKTLISAHLKNLFKNLPKEEFQWVMNPFVKNIKMQHLSLQEQLIDMREDGNLLAEFQQKPLHNWWMGLKNEYYDLVSAANDALLPFGSTYCVVSFSSMTAIKTKYLNKLNLEPDL